MKTILVKFHAKAHSNRTKLPNLPQEVYGNISRFIGDRSDLLSVCFVSRAFSHEAERILYESVDLSYNHSRIQLWFEMIASEEPRIRHRAASVRSLTFGIILPQAPAPACAWVPTSIGQGLRALINLKELDLLNKQHHRPIPQYYAKFILPCHSPYPFRLQKFYNSMFDLEPILPFLETQPDITVWRQLTPMPCELSQGKLLPCLSHATLAPWLIPKLSSCPVAQLCTVTTVELGNVVMERSFIDALAPYDQTLTRLVLERYATEDSMKLGYFVACLAKSLPSLEELCLWHRGDMEVDSTTQETAASFVHFPRLKQCSLLPPRGKNADSLYMDMFRDEKRTALVFFQTSSGVGRLAFPPMCPPHDPVWYARSADAARIGDMVVG